MAVCRTVATACALWGEIARCRPAHCSSPDRGATRREWTSPTAATRCSSAVSSCSATTPSSASPRAPATSSPRSSCARSPRGTSGARRPTTRTRRAPPPATRSASTRRWSPPARCSSTTPSGSSTSARPPWPTPASATPGGMIAMLGGDAQGVRALAARLGLVVANDNAPGQLVLSGPVDALDEAEEVARDEIGARARRLDVTGAFHSPLMEPAAERLRAALDATPIARADDPGLLQRQRRAVRRRAPRAGREPAAPRALARDAAGAAHRAASSASSSSAPARCSPASSSEPCRRRREHGGDRRAHHDTRRRAAPDAHAPARHDRRRLRHRRRAARARRHQRRPRAAPRHQRRVDRAPHRHPRAPPPAGRRDAGRPGHARLPAGPRRRRALGPPRSTTSSSPRSRPTA